ncbi:hypothetical protein ACIBCD_41760 [Nocardia brasiliensis]|uniref:hypothetical protein n=1 Tax=Nocardia brasiliensis TaxID=37326 RepID=UPI00379F7936
MREAQLQLDGQLRELRLEHLRWRRERRQLAYLDLLTDLSSADRANQQLFHELAAASEPAPVDDGRLAEIRRLFKTAEHTTDKIVLEGPADVAAAAQAVTAQLAVLVSGVREFAEPHTESTSQLEGRRIVEDAGQNFIQARNTFLETARIALDEVLDGCQYT